METEHYAAPQRQGKLRTVVPRAARALAAAKIKFPTLGRGGLGCPRKNDWHFSEIENAIAFLEQCKKTRKPTLGSYTLKHQSEAWAGHHGRGNYISNGALICAAVYLDFVVTPSYGPNCSVAINLRDIGKLLHDVSGYEWMSR